MNVKRIIIGTLVGAITLFILAYLIFDLVFGDFYSANMGSAMGVARENPVFWASALGSISYALMLVLAMDAKGGFATVVDAAKVCAVTGFLLWFTVDFTFYGIFNLTNLTLAIVDPLLEAVHAGIAGAVIAAVAGKMSGTSQGMQTD